MPLKKRGEEQSLNLLIEIIFFVVLALVIALPIIMKFFAIPTTGEKKSLDTLAIEINNLGEADVIEAPIYLENYIIRGYTEKGPSSAACKDKSCLCLCKEGGCAEVVACRKLDFTLQADVTISASEKAKNCQLSRTGKEVSISQC